MADHSPTEILTGGAVLALAGGFLIYALQSTGFSVGGPANAYEVTASFRAVDGIAIGTEVRLAGVKIGAVRALDLNAETYRADMRVAIDGGVDLPEDSSIAITSEGLLGGNYVEIIPGGSPFMLEPGAEIEDTQGAISLIGLLSKFVSGNGE